jgi:DNA-binding transcriptional ArsR family regulator
LPADIFNHVVENNELDAVFAALADPSRRAILARLASEGELRVTQVAAPFDVSLNAVSKHVKVLERARLVRRRVEGREHWLSLNPEPLAQAWRWAGIYRHFWEARMDALEAFLLRRGGDGASPPPAESQHDRS